MSEINRTPQVEMREMLMAFVVSRALQVAAELGLADALASGPRDCATVAREVGGHADTIHRLLRSLAGLGVFEQLSDGRYCNTPHSEWLRSDVPGTMRPLARMYGDPALWEAWAGLEHSVRRGGSGFVSVHGTPIFDYLEAHPESARRFDEAMTASSHLLNDAIVEAYDWRQFGTLVDVAGGLGSTLTAILGAARRLNGVLFDLPHVIERSKEQLAMQDASARIRLETGSFFDAIPAGADAYFMKHIIHDWDDDHCLRILGNCRTAMPDHAKLLVCEKIMPLGSGPSITKSLDLVMLVLTDSGKERTESEFRELLARAGLRLARIVPTRSDNSILEVTR